MAPVSSEIPWAHGKVRLPELDPAKARQLLDGAGWKAGSGGGTRLATGVQGVPDGTPLTLDFLTFPTFSKYGDLLRQQLSAVGIDLTIRPLEPAVFAPTVFAQRNFDTNVISYCQGTDPEIGFRRTLDSAQISSAPFTNAAGYRNPEVDQAVRHRQPERAAPRPHRRVPEDPGRRRRRSSVRVAGRDPQHPRVGLELPRVPPLDGLVRGGRIL